MEEKTITLKKGDLPKALLNLTKKEPLSKLVEGNPMFMCIFPIIGIELEKHLGLTEENESEDK